MNQMITGKEKAMKFKVMTPVFALVLVAGFVALTLSLSTGAAPVSASSAKKGDLHVTKECSEWTGAAGGFCTITSSNLAAIEVGSKIFYDQAAGIPTGLLDSDVVLDAGSGNRAVGHCTLDLGTGRGLCTFSDGTGHFTGFHARVEVSPPTDGVNWHWNGTYSYSAIDTHFSEREEPAVRGWEYQ